jgi:hypothetical protein
MPNKISFFNLYYFTQGALVTDNKEKSKRNAFLLLFDKDIIISRGMTYPM